MIEFEIVFPNGEIDFLFGYSFSDACRRSKRNLDGIICLSTEFID